MERFTISLDDKLAEQFDGWIAQRSYGNRSEAIRDLLRAELGKASLQAAADQPCVACLSYVFNHHERQLAERLGTMQHEHHELTISTMHVHLDHEHCLETVMLRGNVASVTRFADEVCAQRGVHHGKLNLISVEAHEPHGAHEAHGPHDEHAHAHAENRPSGAGPVHLHLKPSA